MRSGSAFRVCLLLAASVLGSAGCVGAAFVAAGKGTAYLAAPCTGDSGASSRRLCKSLSFGGVERNYRLYVPSNLRAPAPLIVALHGATQSGAVMEVQTGKGLERRADETGVLVVYPDSLGARWNDGRLEAAASSGKQPIDDVGFLRALVAELGQRYAIDPERVYAAGFSNGGAMTLRLACEATDVFRGFVAVGANLAEAVASRCHPPTARRVALFHGTADVFNPYSGSTGGIYARALSVEATFDVFRALAGCSGAESAPWPQGAPANQTNVVLHRATGCPESLSVVLFEIRGGVHVWPGATFDSGRSFASREQETPELDATTESWRFLELEASSRPAQIYRASGATD